MGLAFWVNLTLLWVFVAFCCRSLRTGWLREHLAAVEGEIVRWAISNNVDVHSGFVKELLSLLAMARRNAGRFTGFHLTALVAVFIFAPRQTARTDVREGMQVVPDGISDVSRDQFFGLIFKAFLGVMAYGVFCSPLSWCLVLPLLPASWLLSAVDAGASRSASGFYSKLTRFNYHNTGYA